MKILKALLTNALTGHGQGPTPSGYELLASGQFVTTVDNTSLTIPVSYDGTPITAFVICDIKPDVIGQTTAWLWSSNDVIAQEGLMFLKRGICRSGQTGDISFTAGIEILADGIKISGRSSSQKVLANTYRWYIWGVK